MLQMNIKSPIFSKKLKKKLNNELLQIKLNNEQEKLFLTLRECKLDNWAGQPVDARGKYTNFLLDRFPVIKSGIMEDNELKSFYEAQ